MGGTYGSARAEQDFRNDVEQVAWDIVSDVLHLEISQRRLGLVQQPKSQAVIRTRPHLPTKAELFDGMLQTLDGFWSRDGKRYYVPISVGNKPKTWVFALRDDKTKKITVTWKTLLSKWKVMVKI